MTEKEFEKKIADWLPKYEEALRRETNAAVKVNEIKFEIEKLQKYLSKEENTIDDLNEDSDENLIELDTELEKLKLKLNETESRVELNVRLSGEKVTESYVKTLVTIDEDVSDLRNKFIEARAKIKIRKAEIQRTRSELWKKDGKEKAKMRVMNCLN